MTIDVEDIRRHYIDTMKRLKDAGEDEHTIDLVRKVFNEIFDLLKKEE